MTTSLGHSLSLGQDATGTGAGILAELENCTMLVASLSFVKHRQKKEIYQDVTISICHLCIIGVRVCVTPRCHYIYTASIYHSQRTLNILFLKSKVESN